MRRCIKGGTTIYPRAVVQRDDKEEMSAKTAKKISAALIENKKVRNFVFALNYKSYILKFSKKLLSKDLKKKAYSVIIE